MTRDVNRISIDHPAHFVPIRKTNVQASRDKHVPMRKRRFARPVQAMTGSRGRILCASGWIKLPCEMQVATQEFVKDLPVRWGFLKCECRRSLRPTRPTRCRLRTRDSPSDSTSSQLSYYCRFVVSGPAGPTVASIQSICGSIGRDRITSFPDAQLD
jgi:hypothetical protein